MRQRNASAKHLFNDSVDVLTELRMPPLESPVERLHAQLDENLVVVELLGQSGVAGCARVDQAQNVAGLTAELEVHISRQQYLLPDCVLRRYSGHADRKVVAVFKEYLGDDS